MVRWFTLRAILLATLIGLTACSGCTDDGVANNSDNNRVEPETEVPAGSRLEHVAEGADPCSPTVPVCAKNVTFSSEIPLKVRLVDGTSQPITNTAINFELLANDATGTTLTAVSAATDAQGFAEVALRGATTAGTAEVIVGAGGAESGVEPIKFVVAVNSKGASSYIINFNHLGNADLKNINVRAFPIATTCEQVREDYIRATTPGQNPTLTAQTQQMGFVTAGNLPQIVIPDVPNGTAYTIEAVANSANNDEVEAAFGCTDGNPPIMDGMSVEVTVDLVDNLPRLLGTYDVTHEFSIVDAVCAKDMTTGEYAGALPSGVCTAIDLIGRLATDPGSFLVGDDQNDGLLHILVDFLPDGGFKDSIESFINNGFIQNLAGDVINDFALEWINNNAPAWVANVVNITGDVYESLKRFRVRGIIQITNEAVPEYDAQSGAVIGLLVPDADQNPPGRQAWNEVIIFWTGDCTPGDEACRERTFSASDVGTNNVVEGFFDGSLVPVDDPMNPGYGLQINEHTLTLNYGVFILGILEKIVLPSVFGDQSVNSLEAALDRLIQGIFGGDNGCDGLAQWVDDTVGGGGGVAESVCNNLLTQAGDAVRDYLSENLTVSGEDNFLIGTPDGEPCRVHEPELYAGDWATKPLPYIEKLGENRPSLECKWNLKLKYGSDPDSVIETGGTFFGERTGF